MSIVTSLLLALQAGPPAVAAASPPRSAFFCQVADRSDARGAEALRALNVLLSGTADSVAERDPIETFDPTGLLDGGRFTRFLRSPNGGYALVSGDMRDPAAALLSLVERDGGPELGAGFGLLRDGPDPRYVGRCIRYRSADTAADFRSFNAEAGRRQ